MRGEAKHKGRVNLNFYLWPSDHHQAGSNLTHHFADQPRLADARRSDEEDPSGTRQAEGAQGVWVKQGQLQHLFQGGAHLIYHKKKTTA